MTTCKIQKRVLTRAASPRFSFTIAARRSRQLKTKCQSSKTRFLSVCTFSLFDAACASDANSTTTTGSEHAIGMLQYAVWTLLTVEGLGVNLQHYNPMIDSEVARQWNIPADWKLKAQMVFGKPAGPPLREKTYQPVQDRMMVFGGQANDN